MQIVGCKEALDLARQQSWYKAYVRNTLSQLSYFRKEYPTEESADKRGTLKLLFFSEGGFSISDAFSWAASPEEHEWWLRISKEFTKQCGRNLKYKKI